MLDARESSAEYAEDRIERTAGLCGYCHYCCAYCGRQVYPDDEDEIMFAPLWRLVPLWRLFFTVSPNEKYKQFTSIAHAA